MLNAGEANDKTMESRSCIIEKCITEAMDAGGFSAGPPFRLDDTEIKALNDLGYTVIEQGNATTISWEATK